MNQIAAPDANALTSERFCIVGDVGAATFPAWISRHARRLGLDSQLLSQGRGRLEVLVTGPAALLDAMALGCSLGPQEVLVDTVEREKRNGPPPRESSSMSA